MHGSKATHATTGLLQMRFAMHAHRAIKVGKPSATGMHQLELGGQLEYGGAGRHGVKRAPDGVQSTGCRDCIAAWPGSECGVLSA